MSASEPWELTAEMWAAYRERWVLGVASMPFLWPANDFSADAASWSPAMLDDDDAEE